MIDVGRRWEIECTISVKIVISVKSSVCGKINECAFILCIFILNEVNL